MDQKEIDKKYMLQAIELAKTAAAMDEVPVGSLIVRGDTILGSGANSPIHSNDPTWHAEIMAIRMAGKNTQNYRLPGTTIYVTLEPCTMCMGAIIHARIERLVFGATDPKTGAAVSCYSIGSDNILNHQIKITSGIVADECAALLKGFFKNRRKVTK